MNRRSNPTVIGAFVVGAVVLIAGAFAIFGGTQIFAEKNRFVALFDEPTNGLRVGANVLLNGVRIGYVSDIDLLVDEVDFDTVTQVTLEILPDDFVVTRDGKPVDDADDAEIDHTILVGEAGLRATLEVESFVTGQLRVELLFRPDTIPIRRAVDPPYPEIPTIRSNIQELLKKVQSWFTDIQENVDFGALSHRIEDVLDGIDELVRSEDLRRSLAGISRLINSRETQQLTESFVAALEDFEQASEEASDFFDNADAGVEVLVSDLLPVVETLNGAVEEAQLLLSLARTQLRGDTDQFYKLGATLDELERTSRSVREFFDYLERNPEALLRGKSDSGN